MTATRYPYYPGCSLQHRSHAYERSAEAVARALGFEPVEMDDWNCCGATEYFSVNRLPAYALVARNPGPGRRAGGDRAHCPVQRLLPEPAQDRQEHGALPQAGRAGQPGIGCR